MHHIETGYDKKGVCPGTPGEYAGYTLCDPRGRKVGKVAEVFSSEDGDVQYIKVKTGLFGQRFFLLPVQSVVVAEELQKLLLE